MIVGEKTEKNEGKEEEKWGVKGSYSGKQMDEEHRKTGEVWKLNEEGWELAHAEMKVNKKKKKEGSREGAGTMSKAQSHFSFWPPPLTPRPLEPSYLGL